MSFALEINGLDRMERDGVRLQRNFAAPIPPVARQLGEVTILGVREQFRSLGRRGPKGRPWTRQQATIDRYTAMNRRGFRVLNEPMRRTDALYQSEATFGGPHGVWDVKDDELIQGTTLAHARIQHERGQTQYDPTDADMRRYASIIRRGIVKDVGEFFEYREDGGEAAF